MLYSVKLRTGNVPPQYSKNARRNLELGKQAIECGEAQQQRLHAYIALGRGMNAAAQPAIRPRRWRHRSARKQWLKRRLHWQVP